MSVTPLPWSPTTRRSRNRSRTDEYGAWTPYGEVIEPGLQRTRVTTALGRQSNEEISKRNQLIIEYLPLVKFIANRIAGRQPHHFEIYDLIESGIIGLIYALEKFDPAHQIKFKTYAEFRIRGAILDELRALDWIPRSTRQKATRLERAYAELENKLGRPASDAEMIAYLKISPQEFDELVQEARGSALISLDELRSESEDGAEHNLIENLCDGHDQEALVHSLNVSQAYRLIADTIDRLPEKERLVISLYYYEELTMKEIGEILAVTESRVSQIHTKAVLRLRGRLLKESEK